MKIRFVRSCIIVNESNLLVLHFFSECVLSFGYNCQHKCSENCINQTCNKVNGSCLHGCTGENTCDLGIGTTVLPNTSWSSMPVIVGGFFGTFVILIIGIITAMFVLR